MKATGAVCKCGDGLCQRILWCAPKPTMASFEELEKVNSQFTASVGKCMLHVYLQSTFIAWLNSLTVKYWHPQLTLWTHILLLAPTKLHLLVTAEVSLLRLQRGKVREYESLLSCSRFLSQSILFFISFLGTCPQTLPMWACLPSHTLLVPNSVWILAYNVFAYCDEWSFIKPLCKVIGVSHLYSWSYEFSMEKWSNAANLDTTKIMLGLLQKVWHHSGSAADCFLHGWAPFW